MQFRTIFGLSCLIALPAMGQDIGKTIVPFQPLVVYDSPPTGLIASPNPIAAISGQGNGLVTYDLQQNAGGDGFTVGAAQTAAPGEVTVIGAQDVAQGNGSKRWLQIDLGKARGDQAGWVLCGDTLANQSSAGQTCQNFQLR